MAIVPPSQDNLQPRVLPKVFADVPSTAEIMAAKQEAEKARQEAAAARAGGRGSSLLVVLLLGMLIAGGIGGYFLYTDLSGQLETERTALETFKKTEHKDALAGKAAAEEQLGTLQSQLSTFQADFQAILDGRARNDKLRDDIKTAAEAKGTRAQKLANAEVVRIDSWSQNRTDALSQLDAEKDALEGILKGIESIKAPQRTIAP